MDIIQEAKEVLKNWKEGLIRPTEHNNDASMDLISRLVDRLEEQDKENRSLVIENKGLLNRLFQAMNGDLGIRILSGAPLSPVGDKQK